MRGSENMGDGGEGSVAEKTGAEGDDFERRRRARRETRLRRKSLDGLLP